MILQGRIFQNFRKDGLYLVLRDKRISWKLHLRDVSCKENLMNEISEYL